MTLALVTGSTGCVGANLVEALNQRGVAVRGLQRSTSPAEAIQGLEMEPVVGDVLDRDSLHRAMQGVDWVFHVAAISDYWRTPAETIYRVNVEGTRNVLDAALEAGVGRFVLTGSVAALGFPRPGQALMAEDDRFNLRPEDFPYAHSKQLAEDLLPDYISRGLHAVAVLPAAVLGPRDIKFVGGELIIQALRGFPLAPSGGLNYIDARDLAQGHIAAAEHGQVGRRYILAGHNLTHRQSLEAIHEVLGSRVPRFDIPRWSLPLAVRLVELGARLGIELPIDRARVLASDKGMYYANDRAVAELGLRIRPFAESVRDTYLWYAEQGFLQRRGIHPRPIAG